MDRGDRESILADEGNVIVVAGAGSGKTTILTKKIGIDLENNKKHYKIAAITFTNKAAKEISERLTISTRGHFLGTNDSFVENEIIRPFIQDALGNNYSNEFEVVYNNKFDTFDEGLELIRSQNKLGVYNDNKKNFKFELALNILFKSRVAQQYIQARYFKLYIDEYQDCDQDMHKLFMYINNKLDIKLFIVGDPKQSIYQWRGAAPELFYGMLENHDNNFNKYQLVENFRCCKEIQNYSNLLEREKNDLYKNVEGVNNVIGIKTSDSKYEKVLDYLDLDKEIAILIRCAKRKNREIARELESYLKSKGHEFIYIPRTPLDDLATGNKNILIELAKYIKDEKYTIYDLINNLPVDLSSSEIKEINSLIEKFKCKNFQEINIDSILEQFFSRLEIEIKDEEEIIKFKETILNDKYDNSYNGIEYKHKIMTIHSSKGLEFEQVLLHANDFKLHLKKDKNEHYVATTRAKDRLVIYLNNDYLNHVNDVVKSSDLYNISNIMKVITL